MLLINKLSEIRHNFLLYYYNTELSLFIYSSEQLQKLHYCNEISELFLKYIYEQNHKMVWV